LDTYTSKHRAFTPSWRGLRTEGPASGCFSTAFPATITGGQSSGEKWNRSGGSPAAAEGASGAEPYDDLSVSDRRPLFSSRQSRSSVENCMQRRPGRGALGPSCRRIFREWLEANDRERLRNALRRRSRQADRLAWLPRPKETCLIIPRRPQLSCSRVGSIPGTAAHAGPPPEHMARCQRRQ
jgi:hypothetical protein